MRPHYCILPMLLSVSMIARSQSWLITGNAGTNPAFHFLGTTDNQPLSLERGIQITPVNRAVKY